MDCKICLDLFSDSEDKFPYILIPCGHTMCSLCLQEMTCDSDLCPFCRQAIASTLKNLGLRDAIEESNLAGGATRSVQEDGASVTTLQRDASRNPNDDDDKSVAEDGLAPPAPLDQCESGDQALIEQSDANASSVNQGFSIGDLLSSSTMSGSSNEEIALECVGVIVDLLETNTLPMSTTTAVLLLFDEYLLRVSNCESETGGQQIVEQTLAINLHGKLCDQILFPRYDNPVVVCHAMVILKRLWEGHPETMQATFDASFCNKFIHTASIHLRDLNIQLGVVGLLHDVIQNSAQSDIFLLEAGLSRWMMRALSAHEYEDEIFQFMTEDFLGCLRPRVSPEIISATVVTQELPLVEYPSSFSYVEFVRVCVCLICSNGSLPRPDASCIRSIFEAARSGHKGCRELALRTIWTILTYPREAMESFFLENGVAFLLEVSDLRLQSVNMNIMVRQSIAKAMNFYGRSFDIFSNFVGMEKHSQLVGLYPYDLVIRCLASNIPPTSDTRFYISSPIQDVLADQNADVGPSLSQSNPESDVRVRYPAAGSLPSSLETNVPYSELPARIPSRPASSTSANLVLSDTRNTDASQDLYSSDSRSTPRVSSGQVASASTANNYSSVAVQSVEATGSSSSHPNTSSQFNRQDLRTGTRDLTSLVASRPPANVTLSQAPSNSMSGRVAAMRQLFDNQS